MREREGVREGAREGGSERQKERERSHARVAGVVVVLGVEAHVAAAAPGGVGARGYERVDGLSLSPTEGVMAVSE